MAKKNPKELEYIEVTDEMLENIKEFRGKVFKDFMQISEDEADEIFKMFVEKGLETAGVELEDAYEQLSLPDFGKVLGVVMERNNMEELFRAIGRLSRNMPDISKF